MTDQTTDYQFSNTNKWDTKQLVTMALFCAIGVVLSFLETPPIVSFLRYDASNAPALITGFAYGPVAGVAVGVIAAVIHGIIAADFSGAVINILIVSAQVIPAALIYKKMHTLKGAIIGLVVGSLVSVAVALLANLGITSLYMSTPELPFEDAFNMVLGMIAPILLPFNLIKAGLNSVIALVVYKAISNLITPKKKQVKGK